MRCPFCSHENSQVKDSRPAEFAVIGDMIADVVDGLAANGEEGNAEVERQVKDRVRALCRRFPIYPELG